MLQDDRERAELMALANDGRGHTAAITRKMIERHEEEKAKTAAEAENNSDIRYIPQNPHRIELALGLERGSLFTAEENEKAKKGGLFISTKDKLAPKVQACSTLPNDQCNESGYNRCTVQGLYGFRGCAFNESYLAKDFNLIEGVEKSKSGLVKSVPVRAVLLDTAKLLGRSDIQLACSALITQFQRGKVSYGDMMAAIYIVYMCKKFDIQAIGCKQVRRYLWAMARGDQRTARVDLKSRIKYVRALIGIAPDDTVTRYKEEGMNKKQVAFAALALGGAAVGGYYAWQNAQEQYAAANNNVRTRQIIPNDDDPLAVAQTSRWIVPEDQQQEPEAQIHQPHEPRVQFEPGQQPQQSHARPSPYGYQPQQQQQQQQQQSRVQYGPQNRPSAQPPQSQWYDMPPAQFATDGQRAEYLLRDLPEFYSKAEARAYMNQHILPQLPPTEYTPIWGIPLRQPEEAVTRRMGDLIGILPD
jgi:hypothetical protein